MMNNSLHTLNLLGLLLLSELHHHVFSQTAYLDRGGSVL